MLLAALGLSFPRGEVAGPVGLHAFASGTQADVKDLLRCSK
jgi:hypothetical protein